MAVLDTLCIRRARVGPGRAKDRSNAPPAAGGRGRSRAGARAFRTPGWPQRLWCYSLFVGTIACAMVLGGCAEFAASPIPYDHGSADAVKITSFRGPRGARADHIVPGRYFISGEVPGGTFDVQVFLVGKTLRFDPPISRASVHSRGDHFSLNFRIAGITDYAGKSSMSIPSIDRMGRLVFTNSDRARYESDPSGSCLELWLRPNGISSPMTWMIREP
jgi:hypothetical protein